MWTGHGPVRARAGLLRQLTINDARRTLDKAVLHKLELTCTRDLFLVRDGGIDPQAQANVLCRPTLVRCPAAAAQPVGPRPGGGEA